MTDQRKYLPGHEIQVGADPSLVPWFCRCGTSRWESSQEAAERGAAEHLRSVEHQKTILTPELLSLREVAIDAAAQSVFIAQHLGIFGALPDIGWAEQGEMTQNSMRAHVRRSLAFGPAPKEPQ